MKKMITKNAEETQNLGKNIAEDFRGGEVVCLEGDLGAGKTTFTQGLLRGLEAKGPYTSPTFAIMKQYEVDNRRVYHIDAYRVESDDILDLGWEEIISDKNTIIIVEWPERIEEIIPESAIRIAFNWVDENKRELVFK